MPTSWEDIKKAREANESIRDFMARAIQQQAKWHKRLGNEHPEGDVVIATPDAPASERNPEGDDDAS